jgi:hypothetical protein
MLGKGGKRGKDEEGEKDGKRLHKRELLLSFFATF